jgi:predicted alpha/beta hydrolase family esterase
MKVVIIPGMGCSPVKQCNWYSWLKTELSERNIDCVLRDFPDPNQCRESIWVPFLMNEIGLDKDTVVIGHSSGAACAMRLLEKKTPLKGVILVAAAYTDLGDADERRSEYFSREWKWEDMKEGAQQIVCFHGTDDHLIPVAEARHIAKKLEGDNFEYHEIDGMSHFFQPWKELLDIFDDKFS